MCGIAGFVSIRPQSALPIAGMTRIVRHRGPDDEGYILFGDISGPPVVAGGPDTPEHVWRSGTTYAAKERIEQASDMLVRVAMGHRRLSIIDLSHLGHQPMSCQNSRYWITYNGEIYNYAEIRNELKSLGHCFLSNSDTEVILAAYDQWGLNCLQRFNGMWAFALYDRQRQEMFLARDRFGVKPLYYWVAPDSTFCFASEIKQFTAFPGWSARINPQRVYDFLVWGMMDHTDETLFAGVYQLRPGCFMRLKIGDQLQPGSFMRWNADKTGKVRVQRWYDLKPDRFSGSFDDAAVAFRERLKDAVRLRLRSDVPVGSCLSGGLDSSSIVCLMNQLLHEQGALGKQKTFSACADVKRFDERKWVDEVVCATDVDAHYVYPSLETLFVELPAMTWHQDEPFGSTSIFAQWNVFRMAASNGVNVMLDGQGADEQLAGYHGFFGARFADLFRKGLWLRLWREVRYLKQLHGYSGMHVLADMADVLLPHSMQNPLRRIMGKTHAAPSWLNLNILGAEAGNPIEESGWFHNILSLSITQLTATSIPRFLHWEDRNSMAHSVESRVPFLDYRLVEFVLSLPDDFKIADGITKRVLREGMSGILPDRIRDRMDKLGFATPEEVWIKEQGPDLFRSKLQRAIDSSQGILSEKCMNMLDKMIKGTVPFNFLVWRMISFGEWMDTFSVLNGGSVRSI